LDRAFTIEFGDVDFEGYPPAADIAGDWPSVEKRVERTNFAAVYAPLPGNLTVSQNLHIFGLMYGVLAFLNGRNRGHEEVSQERCDVLEKQLLRREAILADKSIPLGCLHTV